MALVSPNIALFVFAAVVAIALGIACWFTSYDSFDKGRFHIFIAVLTGLGVVVTFMFYYNVVQLQNQEQQFELLTQAARVEDTLNKTIYPALREGATTVPAFVQSLYPLHNHSAGVPVVGAAEQVIIATLSSSIFFLWENTITTHAIVHQDIGGYTFIFLQWAASPALAEQWETLAHTLSSRGQTYGRLLFAYAKVSSLTREAFADATRALLHDDEFLMLC